MLLLSLSQVGLAGPADFLGPCLKDYNPKTKDTFFVGQVEKQFPAAGVNFFSLQVIQPGTQKVLSAKNYGAVFHVKGNVGALPAGSIICGKGNFQIVMEKRPPSSYYDIQHWMLNVNSFKYVHYPAYVEGMSHVEPNYFSTHGRVTLRYEYSFNVYAPPIKRWLAVWGEDLDRGPVSFYRDFVIPPMPITGNVISFGSDVINYTAEPSPVNMVVWEITPDGRSHAHSKAMVVPKGGARFEHTVNRVFPNSNFRLEFYLAAPASKNWSTFDFKNYYLNVN